MGCRVVVVEILRRRQTRSFQAGIPNKSVEWRVLNGLWSQFVPHAAAPQP